MLFKKVCPRCGRRYPKNFSDCLECGARLVDTEREAQKEQVKKYLPFIGMVVLLGILLAAVIFLVFPLIQYSLASGEAAGTLSKTAGQTAGTTYTMNQPASNGNTQVTVTRTRQGAMSANSRQFLFVTADLQNLRTTTPVTVMASDFSIVDAGGNSYPCYGIGDRIQTEIGPAGSESCELTFEIPQSVEDPRLRFSFRATGDHASQDAYFLLK